MHIKGIWNILRLLLLRRLSAACPQHTGVRWQWQQVFPTRQARFSATVLLVAFVLLLSKPGSVLLALSPLAPHLPGFEAPLARSSLRESSTGPSGR